MKLLYQTHSPFARKALVFAYEKGIADRIEVVHHETSPTAANADVFALNPLSCCATAKVLCSTPTLSLPSLIRLPSEVSIHARTRTDGARCACRRWLRTLPSRA
jgi:hypothetical protein